MRKHITMKTLFKAHYFKIILAIFILGFCNSESKGQNFAKEFQNKQSDTLNQDIIFLYINPIITYRNESIEKMPNFESLDYDIQKEFYNKYAPLADSISDSILLNNYTTELINKLTYFGFKVIHVKEQDVKINIDQRHHSLNVAQLEIEEFNFTDSLTKGNEVFYKQLNGVRFNSWLIYNEADTNSRLVFFCEEEVRDFFEGEIRKSGQEYIASYDYRKLTTNDAHLSAALTGQTSAQYFFNFLMNKYVWIKSSGIDIYYYGIDKINKKIYSDTQPFDNFDIIDYH